MQVGSRAYLDACAAASRRLQAHWTRLIFDPRSGSPTLLRVLLCIYGMLCCLSSLSAKGTAAAVLSIPVGILCAWFAQEFSITLIRRGPMLRLILGGAAAAVLLVMVFLGGGAASFLCLLVQLAAGAALAFGGRRTARGTELLEQTIGFRRYLTRTPPEQLQRLLREDSQYFYRMLPYAEALGCGAAFAERFGNVRLEPCDWLIVRAKTAQEFESRCAEVLSALREQAPKKKR